jgi:hypothetical protein
MTMIGQNSTVVGCDPATDIDVILTGDHRIVLQMRYPPWLSHEVQSPHAGALLDEILRHGNVELTMILRPQILGCSTKLSFVALFGIYGRVAFGYVPAELADGEASALFVAWPDLPLILTGPHIITNLLFLDRLNSKGGQS